MAHPRIVQKEETALQPMPGRSLTHPSERAIARMPDCPALPRRATV